MHIAEVVTIAKSLPLLRLNTYKSLILSYSADYRRIFRKNYSSNKVVKIEKEIRDYEIKLDNGLEMTFDLKGNLIDIDD